MYSVKIIETLKYYNKEQVTYLLITYFILKNNLKFNEEKFLICKL